MKKETILSQVYNSKAARRINAFWKDYNEQPLSRSKPSGMATDSPLKERSLGDKNKFNYSVFNELDITLYHPKIANAYIYSDLEVTPLRQRVRRLKSSVNVYNNKISTSFLCS